MTLYFQLPAYEKKPLLVKTLIPLLSLLFIGCSLSGGSKLITIPEGRIIQGGKDPHPYKIVKRQAPPLPTYAQLVALSRNEPNARKKIDYLWDQPFVDNSYYYKFGSPKPQTHSSLGKHLKLATWNIEKSLNVDRVAKALLSENYYKTAFAPRSGKTHIATALEQRARIAASDILILQEMDIGHCRSGYRDNARYLAKHLKMNYAYGLNQLEIDPHYLGIDDSSVSKCSHCNDLCSLDPSYQQRYKGMFGTAVLSRYPIKRVTLKQLDLQPYNWYEEEAKRPDFIEVSRRFFSKLLFKHKYQREIKIGGRSYMKVDLHIPSLPNETLSIVNVHLEIKTTAKKRKQQLKEILEYVQSIPNPVVLAGDFNSSPTDVSPTSLPKASTKLVTTPSNWVSAAFYVLDVTQITRLRNVANYVKNYRDPLASNIPALFPNKQQRMFRHIRDFRFDDGGAFDFRGDKYGSKKQIGVLSNSNQRKGKGFEFTFRVPRPIGPIGREKLDWFFVKSFLTHSNDPNGSRRLAPHFGETLNAFNYGIAKPFSDHNPMVISLPINEPLYNKHFPTNRQK